MPSAARPSAGFFADLTTHGDVALRVEMDRIRQNVCGPAGKVRSPSIESPRVQGRVSGGRPQVRALN
jgi:hypothetical protein